jgi:hypothetical protein
MKPRRSASVAVMAGALLGAFAYAQAPPQAPEAWTHRTGDGQPDLRGTWVNFDSTPFESDDGPDRRHSQRESAGALGRSR